jgi:hypothetical protein
MNHFVVSLRFFALLSLKFTRLAQIFFSRNLTIKSTKFTKQRDGYSRPTSEGLTANNASTQEFFSARFAPMRPLRSLRNILLSPWIAALPR